MSRAAPLAGGVSFCGAAATCCGGGGGGGFFGAGRRRGGGGGGGAAPPPRAGGGPPRGALGRPGAACCCRHMRRLRARRRWLQWRSRWTGPRTGRKAVTSSRGLLIRIGVELGFRLGCGGCRSARFVFLGGFWRQDIEDGAIR